MLCRLCLIDLCEFVNIFNEDSKTEINEVANLIQKHFQLELKLNDAISTKICCSCWQQLNDFNQFYLMVSEKQQALNLKCEETTDTGNGIWIEPEVHIVDEHKTVNILVSTVDIKDDAAILDEPEIDAAALQQANRNEVELDSATKITANLYSTAYGGTDSDTDYDVRDNSNALDLETYEQNALEQDQQQQQHKTRLQQQQQQQQQSYKTKKHLIRTKLTKKRGRKPKVKAEPTLAMLQRSIRTSMRLQKAEEHTNVDCEAATINHVETTAEALETSPKSLSPTTTTTTTLQTVNVTADTPSLVTRNQKEKSIKPIIVPLKLKQRGRPKGSKTKEFVKRKPKLTDELIAKRSELRDEQRAHTRDLDEYIAANVKLECCLCGHSLKDFVELKSHFRMQHNCTGYMKCCNNRYKKRGLYVDHLRKHKDPEYFRCQPCGKNYKSRNSYQMHMLRFHADKEMFENECDVCGKRFAKTYLLTMHKKTHKGTERKDVCKLCNKAFLTPLQLKAHEKRMHDDDFVPVICDICGANFRNEANFLVHKKSVHREGPPEPQVQCHLCGHWLRDNRCLRRHLTRHQDSALTFKCEQCDVVKSSRAALSSHIRYHHTDTRHECSLCGKQFKIPRNLKEHMATHTGVDLYACPFCPRTFKSHANMHNHKKKMHSGDYVPRYTFAASNTTNLTTANTNPTNADTANAEEVMETIPAEVIETLSLATTTDSTGL